MKKKITFASCGLNPDNNFLQAPMCECGCGEYANLVLEDDDLCNFIYTMLEENGYTCSAIFAIHDNGLATIGVKFSDGITFYGTNSDAKKVIKMMQSDAEFHCYGLLEQVDKDLYRMAME